MLGSGPPVTMEFGSRAGSGLPLITVSGSGSWSRQVFPYGSLGLGVDPHYGQLGAG